MLRGHTVLNGDHDSRTATKVISEYFHRNTTNQEIRITILIMRRAGNARFNNGNMRLSTGETLPPQAETTSTTAIAIVTMSSNTFNVFLPNLRPFITADYFKITIYLLREALNRNSFSSSLRAS